MGSMSYSLKYPQGHSVNWKWGPAVHCSKEIRLVEMKVCFIWMLAIGRKVDSCPRQTQPPDSQWVRAFIGWGRGLQAESGQSALLVILKSILSGLTSIILIVLGTVHLQFSFLWGQFLELWQLMSWLFHTVHSTIEWERLEISSRKLETTREYFMWRCPSGCEGKLGVALESLQGLRDLT